MVDKLIKGDYYYRKKTGETMRYDGWDMLMSDDGRICWDDCPPLDELEEVTWGTPAIPIHEFVGTRDY